MNVTFNERWNTKNTSKDKKCFEMMLTVKVAFKIIKKHYFYAVLRWLKHFSNLCKSHLKKNEGSCQHVITYLNIINLYLNDEPFFVSNFH